MSVLFTAILTAVLALSTPIEQTFTKGETLDYTLTWMKVTGGTARMTLVTDGDSYRITSVAHSSPRFSRFFKVRDEIETTVSRDDFSTLRYVKRLDEEGDKMQEVTTVENGIATRTRKKQKRVPVPRPIFDPISVIYYLRTVDLSPGKQHDITLIADGKVYVVHAHVVRRETLQTPAGKFQTVMIEPEMTSGGVPRSERLFIWYSDDERRLPVRIRTEVKVGAITATLRSVQSGVTSTAPPPLQTD
ncbi:MAG TPA: DUF3108 domain-containing protein [Thermoanaerobaculia bacterium]|nr:DUF3108 domain-containing protein [Thermoanaerobaculia bacterium]